MNGVTSAARWETIGAALRERTTNTLRSTPGPGAEPLGSGGGILTNTRYSLGDSIHFHIRQILPFGTVTVDSRITREAGGTTPSLAAILGR